MRLRAFIFFLFSAFLLRAQGLTIPDAELGAPPTPQRLTEIQAAAMKSGWASTTSGLRVAAVKAYRNENLPAATAWFHVYRWSALFGESVTHFVPRWVAAVNGARVGHPNMVVPHFLQSLPMGATLAPELQTWILGNTDFSSEFFEVISPVDYLPQSFQILNDLWRADPARFKTYASLALAFAVVYDVPPPPDWPHGQVTPAALPRRFNAHVQAFAWWTHQDQIGRTYHRLAKLPANELKYVVDAAAPLGELSWADQVSDYPLSQLARAYTMVRYRNDRLANNQPVWRGTTYRLPDILSEGGICCDQAYFATETGKARGVPTLFFHGDGNDARHAWFGFLDSNGKWQLDAGRYAEQKFVTGYARDPQTWRELNDHELQFLAERFRTLPAFKSSRIHTEFAVDFLAAGENDAAIAAARKAVTFEKRNAVAWDTMIAAQNHVANDPRVSENSMREAALAFQRYPDLEAAYVNRVANSLRARGQTSEADAEVRHIALKNQGSRSDLSTGQARETLMRAVATQTIPEQVKAYNSVLDLYGRGAGLAFFDGVVLGFLDHLMQQQQKAEAMHALDRARHTLKVEPGSQLDQDMAMIEKDMKSR